MSFLGGASLSLLWLKIGALLGLREVCDSSLIPGYVAAAGALGGVLMLVGQALWGAIGPRTARLLRSDEAGPASSRVVWGLSATPLVVVLIILLPLDILIVGSGTFTTDRLADPLATSWAAFSIAAWLSAALWAVYLLMRGFQVQTKLSAGKAWLGALASIICMAFVVSAFVLATSFVPQGAGCRT
ncbi:MAG: hypothetical protein QOG54_2819 [Actinomycetota bacterium]|jgi:hypothetical protein|nr:hypothetical protein [Actinomycetota bacterium]